MIPGKKYKPEDILQIAWRHRWLLVLPLLVTGIGATMYAYSLPARWMSTALIQVVPQRVPESYVRSTITARIEDRLESIRQLILSRTRLEALVQEFNLYPEQRAAGLMQDVVDHMRNVDIRTEIVKGDVFQVSYVSGNPRLAMRVTERLAGLFIEENLRDRAALAVSSSRFLEGQLGQVRQRLEETEKKLAAYRRNYAGQLPDQVDSNLSAVASSQMQLQQIVQALAQARDRRLLVQRQMADVMQSPSDSSGPSAPVSAGGDPGNVSTSGSAADQLESARRQVAQMELRLKPEHPDMIRARRALTELERKAEQESLQQPLSPTAPAQTVNPADAARRLRMRGLQSELESLDRQIAGYQSEESRVRGLAGQYQARVEAAPMRETELIALTRDYQTISQQYSQLLAKNEDAKMAADLEQRQSGEQFRLLEPARVPERPFSPNRPRLIFMGVALGVAFGCALVLLLEYRDRSLRTDEDVMLALALPVLAVIPRMTNRRERSALRRRNYVIAAAGAMMVACIGVIYVWRFVQWREYLPW
jgi:polysaccharide chain length determinant protein (PEP-CTERM system associated)